MGDVPIGKGTGRNMADATMRLLREWGIDPNMFAIGFDTTVALTGWQSGGFEMGTSYTR